MPPLIVFLSHRDRLSRDDIQERIHRRLSKEGGCRNVRYSPSRLRRRYVYADVDPIMFLGNTYSTDRARLEVRFWKPVSAPFEYYWINWIEPARGLLVGWHRDDGHGELGECHIQLGYQDETVTRKETTFIDAHPLSIFEQRLRQLPAVLKAIDSGDTPTLPSESVE